MSTTKNCGAINPRTGWVCTAHIGEKHRAPDGTGDWLDWIDDQEVDVEAELRRAALVAIRKLIVWPSMHWGVEDVHQDAWRHIANAAADAVIAALPTVGYTRADEPKEDRA